MRACDLFAGLEVWHPLYGAVVIVGPGWVNVIVEQRRSIEHTGDNRFCGIAVRDLDGWAPHVVSVLRLRPSRTASRADKWE